MLVLSSRVSGVFELVEQLSSIVQTIMATLSSMLPALIFILFTGMISNGKFGAILGSWKSIVVIIALMIAFTTASSGAAFTTNIEEATKELGIDKKLVEFATPLGQVLFMPAYLAMLFGTEVALAEASNIPITLPWLLIGLVTNLLVAFAVPPIPGGAVMGFTVVFTQLGIPLEMMAVAIAINAIPDFPATAVQVSGWQLTLIDVADSLDMLDKEILRKNKS